MRIQCPFCRTIVGVGEEPEAGQKVTCPNCGKSAAVPESPFDPGCVINDFVIEGIIGRGGMSVVYRAEQLSLSRTVALKILSPKYAAKDQFRRAFLQEAKAAARLNHPNIVRALAVGYEEGVLFYAMEFIEGKTLGRHIETENSMDVDSALNVIQQAAEALHAAWTQEHLIHRDIKPDNIMLASDGYAKIMDLGIAVIATEATRSDAAGTPAYMAPEQFVGGFLDCRTDIYALGVTLYHCLVGYVPFEGDDTQEVARKHHWEEVRFPERDVIDLPPRIRKLIEKMMAKSAEERYATYDELLEEIYRIRRRMAPENDQVPHVHTISFSKYRRRGAGREDPGELYEKRHERKRRVAIAREDAERKPAPTVQESRRLRLGMVIAAVLVLAVVALLTAIGVLTLYRPAPPASWPRRVDHFLDSRQAVLEPGSDAEQIESAYRGARRIWDDFPERPEKRDELAALRLQQFMLDLQRSASRRAVGRLLDELESKLTARLKPLGLTREEMDVRLTELRRLQAELDPALARLAALEERLRAEREELADARADLANQGQLMVAAAHLRLIDHCRGGDLEAAHELVATSVDDSAMLRSWKERFAPRLELAAAVLAAVRDSGETFAGKTLPAGRYGGNEIGNAVIERIEGSWVLYQAADAANGEVHRLRLGSMPAAAVLSLPRERWSILEWPDVAWSFAMCWGDFAHAAELADSAEQESEVQELMIACFRQEMIRIRTLIEADNRRLAMAEAKVFMNRYGDLVPFAPYEAELRDLFQTTRPEGAAALPPTTP